MALKRIGRSEVKTRWHSNKKVSPVKSAEDKTHLNASWTKIQPRLGINGSSKDFKTTNKQSPDYSGFRGEENGRLDEFQRRNPGTYCPLKMVKIYSFNVKFMPINVKNTLIKANFSGNIFN
jgi:hypothetical protein